MIKKVFKATVILIVIIFLLSSFAFAIVNDYEGDTVIGSLEFPLKAMGTLSVTVSETALGDVAADAVRWATGADLAVLNGGDFASDLWGGEITWSQVRAVFAENRELSVATITPNILTDILEEAVSHIVLTEDGNVNYKLSEHGGFAQISGFTFKYDGSAQPGSRVVSITLESGETLDLNDDETELTVAATTYMLSGGYTLPFVESEPLDITLASALAAYISEYGASITASGNDRISLIGVGENSLTSYVPKWMLVCIAPIMILIGCMRIKKGGQEVNEKSA